MRCFHFQFAILKTLLLPTLDGVYFHTAPFIVQNDPSYPFLTSIGYEDANDYFEDASSSGLLDCITVPLLVVAAADDDLVCNSTSSSLRHSISKPNVIYVKTRSGGHLGFHISSLEQPLFLLSFRFGGIS